MESNKSHLCLHCLFVQRVLCLEKLVEEAKKIRKRKVQAVQEIPSPLLRQVVAVHLYLVRQRPQCHKHQFTLRLLQS